MTNRPNNENEMTHTNEPDPIHRILASEGPILPSSGFLASVMERVKEESQVPAPIPFPWKRTIPGFALATGLFGWATYEFIREGIPSLRDLALAQSPLPPSVIHPLEQAAWVALALAVSLFSWKLSRRLSGQS
jgi:hypothetical protein